MPVRLSQMPLLLAIEPDKDQASLIATLAKETLRAELVVTSSASEALTVLATRVPDLILTSSLLSPRDESALTDRLRELDAAGTRMQTLVIPMLAEPTYEPQQKGGLLAKLNWRRPKASAPDACDPGVFAEQIAEYLKRAAAHRTLLERLAPRAPEPSLAAAGLHVEDPAPPPLESFLRDNHFESYSTDEPAKVFDDAMFAELVARLAPVPHLDAESVPFDPLPSPIVPPAHLSAASFDRADEEPAHESRPAPPAVRSDLLEILASIQRDLEPLRIDRNKTTAKTAGAIQDEWGFFDPNQCGIAALFARLEHIADRNAASQR